MKWLLKRRDPNADGGVAAVCDSQLSSHLRALTHVGLRSKPVIPTSGDARYQLDSCRGSELD